MRGFRAFRAARQFVFAFSGRSGRRFRPLCPEFPRFFRPRTAVARPLLRARVFLAGMRALPAAPRLFPALPAALRPPTAKKPRESRPAERNARRFAETPLRKHPRLDRRFLGFPADPRPRRPAGIRLWRGFRPPVSPLGDSRGLVGDNADAGDDRGIPAVP